jgi:hypothetical protein
VNRPFAGALVPNAYYGLDRRVQSVMIEVRRDLYMDERTGDRLPRFADVQRVLTEFRALLEASSPARGSNASAYPAAASTRRCARRPCAAPGPQAGAKRLPLRLDSAASLAGDGRETDDAVGVVLLDVGDFCVGETGKLAGAGTL